MSETSFRTSTPMPESPAINTSVPTPEPNKQGYDPGDFGSEPIEANKADEVVLKALEIDDTYQNLPLEDQQNLHEVKSYIADLISHRGLKPVAASYQKVINDLKEEMGMDNLTEPSVVLDRIGGMIKAWRGISFVKDAKERRSLFMKLARMGSSKEMNDFVFNEMERKKVWQ